MDGVRIEIDDLNRLVATFEQRTAGMDHAVGMVVRKAAFEVERHAKSIVPVDTGFLKNSIHTEEIINNGRTYGMDVIADANYAAFVEDGTSRQAPQPYMRPALEKIRPTFEAALLQVANPLGEVT